MTRRDPYSPGAAGSRSCRILFTNATCADPVSTDCCDTWPSSLACPFVLLTPKARAASFCPATLRTRARSLLTFFRDSSEGSSMRSRCCRARTSLTPCWTPARSSAARSRASCVIRSVSASLCFGLRERNSGESIRCMRDLISRSSSPSGPPSWRKPERTLPRSRSARRSSSRALRSCSSKCRSSSAMSLGRRRRSRSFGFRAMPTPVAPPTATPVLPLATAAAAVSAADSCGVPAPGRGALPPRRCCTTCASSCASKRVPDAVAGANSPGPNTMSFPTLYACASSASAEAAAATSVWTRTGAKLCPNRDSI